jgi:RNA polymerase sigma-70 factor (ECF subfamily)
VYAEAPAAVSALEAVAAPSFASVYREHVETVARWVARLGGQALDVEDVTHDVFLKVQRELPKFRGDARLSTWLYAMTANTVRTRRRIERFRRLFRGDAEEGETVADERPLPPDVLEEREAQRTLYRVLDLLPDRDREVLVLFELEGCSGQEVAELLRTRLATVWVWRHRARERFARVLEAQERRPA